MWIWEHNDASKYISQMNKTDKTPSVSIVSSPKETAATLCPQPPPLGSERVEEWDVGEASHVESLSGIGTIFSSLQGYVTGSVLIIGEQAIGKHSADF